MTRFFQRWRYMLLGLGLVAFAFWAGQAKSSSVRTVSEVIQRYGPSAEAVLKPAFARAGVAYPPAQITLLGFKQEKRLELWARQGSRWHWVQSYPMLAASGGAGPKLQEGDGQVPEGLYRLEYLNPNSQFHLSIKLNYPNAFDRAQAQAEGRTRLGGDIFIHGQAVSIGCLAMGDRVAEQLFVLVQRVGLAQVQVLLAPRDFRRTGLPSPQAGQPAWLPALYQDLDRALQAFTLDSTAAS